MKLGLWELKFTPIGDWVWCRYCCKYARPNQCYVHLDEINDTGYPTRIEKYVHDVKRGTYNYRCAPILTTVGHIRRFFGLTIGTMPSRRLLYRPDVDAEECEDDG